MGEWILNVSDWNIGSVSWATRLLTKKTCLGTSMLNTLNIKLKLNQNPALIKPNETNNKYKPLLN